MGSHYLTNIFTALFSRARVSNLFRLILKRKKYSVRTFHTYLARCSLSIDSEAFVFPPRKIFFSVICFFVVFFDSIRENRKLLEAVASASVMEFTAPFGRACACVCVRMRVRPSPRADNF